MEFVIKIKRQESCDKAAYWQSFVIEDDGLMSVANVLEALNNRTPLLDAKGNQTSPVAWECGCLQRKCGACAMLINGKPTLACLFFLSALKKRDKTVTLEPLSKFPLISDLIVDRSGIFENLKKAKLWLDSEAHLSAWSHEMQYQSARCLMCGCCLEVCPNFTVDSDFSGAVTAVNAYRVLDQSQYGEHRKEIVEQYKRQYWNGCGKSLSCHNVCPIDLPVEDLLVKSNAAAVWGR
jgi:succinate dehydrogenase / fumarate reductase iron-sulfur subunit